MAAVAGLYGMSNEERNVRRRQEREQREAKHHQPKNTPDGLSEP